MEQRPVVIVGSGPAGCASALFLHARDPALARDALILEKAHHPRRKICAGGLIPHTLRCLDELGIPLTVPNVAVHRAAVEVPGRAVTYEGEELCRVIRRDQFDESLVVACRARGVEVREAEKVVAVRREQGGIRVETERGSYHTRALIGADGSGSVVRRSLLPHAPEHVGRAVMCDIPLSQTDWSGFIAERYDFIFRSVADGLRGYAWAFPCLIDGAPHVNLGVYSVVAKGSAALLAKVMREELARLGAPSTVPMQSFPIRWSGRGGPVATPHALLAGDAAGVDPLMGEGISFCFEYGRRAADALVDAVATGDFSFAAYEHGVHTSWMGRKLRRLDLGVRLFYGPTWRLWFAIAARSRTAQEIGIRWYNGVDGWDQRSVREALRAWWRGEVHTPHAAGA